MKTSKILTFAAAALFTAGSAFAAVSQNVVGVCDITVTAATGWVLIPVQFRSAADGNNTSVASITADVGLVSGDQIMVLASGTTATSPTYNKYTWNGTGWTAEPTYNLVSGESGTSPAAGEATIGIGSILWFKRASGEGARILHLQGEVLTAASSVSLSEGYNLVGNPSPTENLTLAGSVWTNAGSKDKIFLQTTAGDPTQGYSVYRRFGTQWRKTDGTKVDTITIAPKCAMWYIKASGSTIESIPLEATVAD